MEHGTVSKVRVGVAGHRADDRLKQVQILAPSEPDAAQQQRQRGAAIP